MKDDAGKTTIPKENVGQNMNKPIKEREIKIVVRMQLLHDNNDSEAVSNIAKVTASTNS